MADVDSVSDGGAESGKLCGQCKKQIIRNSRVCVKCDKKYHPGCLKQRVGFAVAEDEGAVCCHEPRVMMDDDLQSEKIDDDLQSEKFDDGEGFTEECLKKRDQMNLLKFIISELRVIRRKQDDTEEFLKRRSKMEIQALVDENSHLKNELRYLKEKYGIPPNTQTKSKIRSEVTSVLMQEKSILDTLPTPTKPSYSGVLQTTKTRDDSDKDNDKTTTVSNAKSDKLQFCEGPVNGARRVKDDANKSSAEKHDSGAENISSSGEEWEKVENGRKPIRKENRSHNKSRNLQPKIQVGRGEGNELVSGPKKAWLHIGKLRKETTEEQVKLFLKQRLPKSESTVTKLESKGENASFRVGVDFLLKDTVMNPDFWPSNVTFRRFLFKRLRKTDPD